MFNRAPNTPLNLVEINYFFWFTDFFHVDVGPEDEKKGEKKSEKRDSKLFPY